MSHSSAQDLAPELARILEDPATSDWLRYAAISLVTRDPLDALGDAEALLALAAARADAALAGAGEGAS